MSAECSRSSLEIPREVVSILASIVGGLHSQPVWTFARHGNGYSLKLFWKAQSAAPLNNAHSTNSGRMNRNRRRMEAFLSKKTSLSERVNVGTNGTPGPSFLSSSEAELTHIQCLSTSTSSPAETESQHPVSLHDIYSNTHSPVAKRTRSHSQKADIQSSGEPVCTGVDPAPSPSASVETDTQGAVVHKSAHPLVLKLPETLSVTKHHVDFVKCDDVDTANAVKKCMEQQWSTLVKPGSVVKVKVKDELVPAVVENSYFISKLSFDCLYFFATAKADVRLTGSNSSREYQLRDLVLL